MEEGSSAKISVLVVCGKPLGFDLLLGIDAIKSLGGMVVGPMGLVQLSNKEIKCVAISVNEPDFTVTFNDWSWGWTVVWEWSEGHTLEGLDNRLLEYLVAAEILENYEREICTWMSNGWLVPYEEEELGPPKGLIPLMVILQQHKSKVHPVMDFQQINHHVDVFTANTDVCTAKLHKWLQKGSNVSLLNLRRAYLQVCVHKIGRQRYCLTHLGFGLNVAPLIMKALVSTVLSSLWRLVCRWPGTEYVGWCQLLSDWSGIGGTQNSAGGCLLAATKKWRPTYQPSQTIRRVKGYQFCSPVERPGAAHENRLCVHAPLGIGHSDWENVSAYYEMLIRRWLNTLKELMEEYKLTVDVILVPSNKHMADWLTKVPQ